MASSQQSTSSSGPSVKKPRVESDSWSVLEDHSEEFKHEHAFSINNFSKKMQQTPLRTSLESGKFTFKIKDKQTGWKVHCYPNGNTVKGYLSIFLHFDSDQEKTEFPVEFALSIIDKEGSKRETRFVYIMKDYYYQSGGFGISKFISHGALKNAEANLLPDDVLTIHCAITVIHENNNVVTSGTSRPVLAHGSGGAMEEQEQASILKCVDNVFRSGQFSDCLVVCQGREYKCHRAVLAERSSVFNAMFTVDMEESRSRKVDIKEHNPDTVDKMLAYIYTGKVEEMGGNADTLLAAANMYDLPGLKKMCEKALIKAMNVSNALDILLLADLNQADGVRELALKFIVENGKEIVSQDGWVKKLERYPQILSDMFKASIQK